ncbi:hypothetical protein FACS1894110_14580 [Spirochaetia bacterium]|nr:hypothetical protein FACS1894110_14580 [Spirochaetia bacterium]
MEQYSLFLDTCVWLDIANKPEPILPIITQLIDDNSIKIITSKIIIDEFERNKTKIVDNSKKRLKQQLRDGKNALKLFDGKYNISEIDNFFDEINSQIPNVSDKAFTAITMISDLLKKSTRIELSDNIISLVFRRALDKKAPFHRNKNSIADALLMEQFHQFSVESSYQTLYFITHNTDDFSDTQDNRRIHPDYNGYFEKENVRYEINIMNVINQIDENLLGDYEFENYGMDENRSIIEILNAEGEFMEKIWYGRHQNLKYKVECEGEHVDPEIWKGARASAKKMEKKYGKNNLVWDDFEWGMLNGKLSALRWVLGEDWDMLDT